MKKGFSMVEAIVIVAMSFMLICLLVVSIQLRSTSSKLEETRKSLSDSKEETKGYEKAFGDFYKWVNEDLLPGIQKGETSYLDPVWVKMHAELYLSSRLIEAMDRELVEKEVARMKVNIGFQMGEYLLDRALKEAR